MLKNIIVGDLFHPFSAWLYKYLPLIRHETFFPIKTENYSLEHIPSLSSLKPYCDRPDLLIYEGLDPIGLLNFFDTFPSVPVIFITNPLRYSLPKKQDFVDETFQYFAARKGFEEWYGMESRVLSKTGNCVLHYSGIYDLMFNALRLDHTQPYNGNTIVTPVDGCRFLTFLDSIINKIASGEKPHPCYCCGGEPYSLKEVLTSFCTLLGKKVDGYCTITDKKDEGCQKIQSTYKEDQYYFQDSLKTFTTRMLVK